MRTSRGSAPSGRRADQLQPGGKLVAGAQAHRQLVALDRRELGLYRRVYLQRSLAHGRALAGLCRSRRLGLREWQRARARQFKPRPEPRCAAARRPCSGATRRRRCVSALRRKLRTRSADVRRDQQVRATPQRMPIGQRLGIGHIERSANPSRFQCFNQRIRCSQLARARHSPAARPAASAQIAACRSAMRVSAVDGRIENHDLGLRQKSSPVHLLHAPCGSVACCPCNAHELDIERRSMRSISLPIEP